MPDSVIYITFKDTVNSSSDIKATVENLASQIISAARRIENDKTAIYDYIREDSPYHKPEKTVIPTSIPVFKTATVHNAEDDMMEAVFKESKKTDKSLRIIKYLVQNSGLELSVDQISSGASVPKSDLSVWFATTGKHIKAIVKTSRGSYRFNPNLLTNDREN